MVKINQFVAPSNGQLWCINIEYVGANGPVNYSHYDNADINNALSPDGIEYLKEQSGQNIALITVSEEPN